MSDAVDSAIREIRTEAAAQAAPAAARQQLSALNEELEEATNKFERLQGALAIQQHLEELLREGRTRLQDLRSRLQEMTAERDVLQTALNDHATAHRLEIEGLQRQIQEDARDALAQRTLAEQHERAMLSKHEEQRQQIDALRQQFEKTTAERDGLAARLDEREREMLLKEEEQRLQFGRATAERDRLATQLKMREAAEKQFAVERSEQRSTFERLLAEARSTQRDLVQELDEQSQHNRILREAAIRAQSLARQIMDARESVTPKDGSRE